MGLEPEGCSRPSTSRHPRAPGLENNDHREEGERWGGGGAWRSQNLIRGGWGQALSREWVLWPPPLPPPPTSAVAARDCGSLRVPLARREVALLFPLSLLKVGVKRVRIGVGWPGALRIRREEAATATGAVESRRRAFLARSRSPALPPSSLRMWAASSAAAMLGAQWRRNQSPRAAEVSGPGGRRAASQGLGVRWYSWGVPRAADQPSLPRPGLSVGGGGTTSPLHASCGVEKGGAREEPRRPEGPTVRRGPAVWEDN